MKVRIVVLFFAFFILESIAIAKEPRGFVMDMTPLISNDGRIRAIAPGAAAIAGSVRKYADNTTYKPFVWSREKGFRLLPTDRDPSWGTAFYISDDGTVTIGYLHGTNVKNAGLIWLADGRTKITNNDFGVFRIHWVGLSADGKLAAGTNNWQDGWLIDHAAIFTILPGARVFNPEKWEREPTAKRKDGSTPDDPFVNRGKLVAMSRNGNTFAYTDDYISYLTDAKRTWVRELKIGGTSNSEQTLITTGEIRTPLLKKGDENHPLPLQRDAYVQNIVASHLSRDGDYAVGTVRVRYPLTAKAQAVDAYLRLITEGGSIDEKEETWAVRWDRKGQAILIGRENESPIAVSDDAKTILLDRRGIIRIWKEGKKIQCFHDYLAEHGLQITGLTSRYIWGMVMSPDGRCFAGYRASNDWPTSAFLACINDGSEPHIEKPDWTLP